MLASKKMLNKQCILCLSVKEIPTTLDDDTISEHVIPNRLGGQLESKELICNSCNNETGSTIDKALVHDFLWIRNGLEIRSGRRQAPPDLRRVTSPEGMINLGPGWKPYRGNVERKSLGEKHFRIRADDTEKGIDAVVQYLRSKGINSAAQFRQQFQLIAKETASQLPSVQIDIEVGGVDVARAIAKIAFEYLSLRYLAKDIAHFPIFNAVRDFIRRPLSEEQHSNKSPAFMDTVTILPEPKVIFPEFYRAPCHYIAVWTAKIESGFILLAEVRLFGIFRWTVELSDKLVVPIPAVAYAINPMARKSASHSRNEYITVPRGWKQQRCIDLTIFERQLLYAKLMCEEQQLLKAEEALLIECAQEVLGVETRPASWSVTDDAVIKQLFESRKVRLDPDYRLERPVDLQTLIPEIEKRLDKSRT